MLKYYNVLFVIVIIIVLDVNTRVLLLLLLLFVIVSKYLFALFFMLTLNSSHIDIEN